MPLNCPAPPPLICAACGDQIDEYIEAWIDKKTDRIYCPKHSHDNVPEHLRGGATEHPIPADYDGYTGVRKAQFEKERREQYERKMTQIGIPTARWEKWKAKYPLFYVPKTAEQINAVFRTFERKSAYSILDNDTMATLGLFADDLFGSIVAPSIKKKFVEMIATGPGGVNPDTITINRSEYLDIIRTFVVASPHV